MKIVLFTNMCNTMDYFIENPNYQVTLVVTTDNWVLVSSLGTLLVVDSF